MDMKPIFMLCCAAKGTFRQNVVRSVSLFKDIVFPPSCLLGERVLTASVYSYINRILCRKGDVTLRPVCSAASFYGVVYI